jgi:hypothetical protein
MRDLPLPKTSERAILAHNSPESGECRIKWFTKFGSREKEIERNENNSKTLYLKGLDILTPEKLDFGHYFPEESEPIQDLFDEYLVRAPDFYSKRILRTGYLPKHPFIHYDAVFYIEGNRVKQGYNKMLRRQDYTPPAGAYTVQERYGVWLCKDFIPIERKNEWIATRGTEFTKFHAFFNCQYLSLTANRGSVANTPSAMLADVETEIRNIYEEIISGDDWREMDWLESEAIAYQTGEKERNDFTWRQKRALRSNVAQLEELTLVEPTRESGVYALLVQLSTVRPVLFPFSIVDYDTHSGIDVLAKMRDASQVGSAELYYVELKYFLEATMNHSFDNIRYVVCWDTEVKHGGKVADVTGKRESSVSLLPIPALGITPDIFSSVISSMM